MTRPAHRRQRTHRIWFRLRRSDILFGAGLILLAVLVFRWYTVNKEPPLEFLGVVVWLTSGAGFVPRAFDTLRQWAPPERPTDEKK